MQDNSILSLNKLRISYKTDAGYVDAVKEINLTIGKGEGIGIMGESGCGKSTIILQILRLLDGRTDVDGNIFYHGDDINKLREKDINKIRWNKIAISFQNSLEVLNPVMNIEKQIAEAIEHHKNYSNAEIRERLDKLFCMVGLDKKWAAFYPHELSGGMRQKVLIAMAIACKPEILILDEPTTALDVQNKREIISLVERLQEEIGFSLITISHDVEVINKLSSRLYVMYDGYFVEEGPTKRVFEEPFHSYTRGLLNSSPSFFKYKDLWGIRDSLENRNFAGTRHCVFLNRCPQGTPDCFPMPLMEEVEPGRKVACHKHGIETLVKIRGVSKTYRNHSAEVPAVKKIDLDIKSGEVISLIGKSGSGKSTLAQLMVNLIEPDNGEVYFLGKRTDNSNWITSKPGGIQIVLQDPISATNEYMRNIDVVLEPLTINKIGTKEENTRKVIKLLRMVQLPSDKAFLERRCSELSGGQRQRLAIARALIMNPKVLIADEITSMLDPSTQANLMRELKSIQNIFGFTMIYITHDLYMARKVADRVVVMHEGSLVETGMASVIFDFPRHETTKKLFQHYKD